MTIARDKANSTVTNFASTGIDDNASSTVLTTTNTGVDVTGTVTADGLTVESGIGNTALLGVSTDSGTEVLLADQVGGVSFKNVNGDIELRVNGAASTAASSRLAQKINDNGDISFYADNGTTQGLFWQASTQRLGLGATSPSEKLDVSGGLARFSNNTTPANEADGGAYFGKLSGTAFMSSQGGITFRTASTERMRIDNSGNVGIGTNSPSRQLSVYNSGSDANVSIRTGQSASGNTQLMFGDAEADNTGRVLYNHSTNHMQFNTNSTERMRIDSSGNVLVGKTVLGADTNGFEVRSNGETVISVNNNIPIDLNRTGSDGTVVNIRNDTTPVGNISVSGSSTSYNTSSDYRLKTEVNYDWDATTRLKQLKPARFEWISDNEDAVPVDGFLAHEVQDVVPEAITGTHNEVEVWKDGDELPDGVSVGDNKLDDDGNTIPVYQGIDQSKLVPLLVKTIQELEARITALEAN